MFEDKLKGPEMASETEVLQDTEHCIERIFRPRIGIDEKHRKRNDVV